MLVSHIFHTAQTDQYPRTYPLILTYSYISRRWDKWNEVFQGEEISRFIHKHLPFSTVILKRWHHRSKRIFTNVIIHFGRTFLTPLKQCHKHCSTHKPVIVITNVLFNGMRDYAFIHTEFKFPLHSEYILRPWILTWILYFFNVLWQANNMNNIV